MEQSVILSARKQPVTERVLGRRLKSEDSDQLARHRSGVFATLTPSTNALLTCLLI